MSIRQKKTAVAAAILVIAAVMLLLCLGMRPLCLRLSDAETGQVYAKLPLAEGESFSVTFRHSVNKSDVTEIYERRGREIWLTGCVYYGFGAGVAEVLEPSWTLSYGDAGEMVIGSIEMKMDSLTYIVGTVYDHILELGGERVILNGLCGRNTKVHFDITR